MSDTDWEKRARELASRHEKTEWHMPPTSLELSLLQLGREMADEAFGRAVKGVDAKMREAADARAEEIAQKIRARGLDVSDEMQRIARSTIRAAETRKCEVVGFEPDAIVMAVDGNSVRVPYPKPAQSQPLPPLSAVEDAERSALESALLRWMKDNTGVECASVTVTRRP